MHEERLSTCKFNPAPEMTDGLETVRLNGSRSISSSISFVDMLISIVLDIKNSSAHFFSLEAHGDTQQLSGQVSASFHGD